MESQPKNRKPRQARFSQKRLTAAIKAAVAAGLSVVSVEINDAGGFRLHTASDQSQIGDDLDRELAAHRQKLGYA